MNIMIRCIKKNLYVILIFLFFLPISGFCRSDFMVAYLVDDQIISNYDIEQARRLHNLLTDSNISKPEIEKIVISEKIKEIYAQRLKIASSDAEIEAQIDSFLRSNQMKMQDFRSLVRSKGIDIQTFFSFVEANIRWQKVLDNRFGYKINNLTMQDVIPLVSTPEKIEKEYEFSEIFISYKQWDPQRAKLIASRLEIELKAGANFAKAVEKFSSADSKLNNGKVGPIKKSRIPKQFRDVLNRLKKNEISSPLEIEGGLIILKLNRTRSYKTVRAPIVSVTFSVSNAPSNSDAVCSEERKIKGPVLLSKVDKKIGNILSKLMPGESYKLSDDNGPVSFVTLCDRFLNKKQGGELNFETIKKNEEAQRLSNALMLELRRNTTVIKK